MHFLSHTRKYKVHHKNNNSYTNDIECYCSYMEAVKLQQIEAKMSIYLHIA